MTTQTKKTTTTRKKTATKPKAGATKPVKADEQVEQTLENVPACPQCGAVMVRRNGPYGEFWGCSRFKSGECKTTIKIEQ